jgi:hypothetical protein
MDTILASADRTTFTRASMRFLATFGNAFFFDSDLARHGGRLPFYARPVAGRWVVTASATAALRPGDVLETVDGRPFEAFFRELRPMISVPSSGRRGRSSCDCPGRRPIPTCCRALRARPGRRPAGGRGPSRDARSADRRNGGTVARTRPARLRARAVVLRTRLREEGDRARPRVQGRPGRDRRPARQRRRQHAQRPDERAHESPAPMVDGSRRRPACPSSACARPRGSGSTSPSADRSCSGAARSRSRRPTRAGAASPCSWTAAASRPARTSCCPSRTTAAPVSWERRPAGAAASRTSSIWPTGCWPSWGRSARASRTARGSRASASAPTSRSRRPSTTSAPGGTSPWTRLAASCSRPRPGSPARDRPLTCAGA